MTKQTEALRMAIAEMVRAEKVFDDIGLLLIKFGVKPSDISFHKESFLAPSIQACKEALDTEQVREDDAQPAQGEIVVTKNDTGQIVMVSRQDSEGNILSVIAESENT